MKPAKNKAQQLLRRKRIGQSELSRVTGVKPSAAHKWLHEGSVPKLELQYLIEKKYPDVAVPLWTQKPIKNGPKAAPESGEPSTSVVSAASELTLTERLAGARLEIRALAERADALLTARAERDTVAAELAPLRGTLLPALGAYPLVYDAVAMALAPPVADPLEGVRAQAAAIEAGLVRLRDEARRAKELSSADKADVSRARVTRLLRRLQPVDRSGLLGTATWAQIVNVAAVTLRDAPKALEAARAALVGSVDTFAAALRDELESVRHITWPCPRYADDVQGFCREILGFELYEKQLEVVALLMAHDQVACASGHRVGKSRLVAAIALWWYCAHPDGRVLMTAPGDRQLQHVLWREVRALVACSGRCLDCRTNDPHGPRPCVHSQKISGILSDRATGGLLADDGRQVIGFSSTNTEAAAGFASAKLLVLADEASGVRDEIFDALAGNRAGAGSKLLCTGNPTKLSGRFYEMFFKRADSYATIRIASTDTPNYQSGENVIPGLASREFVERSKQEYGEDSAFYMVRVLGQHAIGDDAKLFPLSILLEAQERWNDTVADGPLCIGVDCAGGTEQGDFSAFCVRRGQKILQLESLKLPTAEEHLQHVLQLARTFEPDTQERVRVVVDADGALGVTIAAHLESGSKRLDVVRHHGHVILSRSTQFATKRDECIANASTWLKRGGAIPADAELEAELNLLALEVIEIGGFDRTRVTSKREIRKALRRSSDRADAFCMAVWDPEARSGYRQPDEAALVADDDEVEELTGRGGGLDPYRGLDVWRSVP